MVDLNSGSDAAQPGNRNGDASHKADASSVAPGRSSGAANNPRGNAAAAAAQRSAGSSENHSAAQGNSSRSGNNSKGSRSSVEQDGGSGWNGKKADWFSEVASCDMFHGDWVRDDSYPLYPEGSCPYLH